MSQNLLSAAVVISALRVNFVSPSDNFCHLLTSFANSLDADQARQDVGPDLDPNYLIL